MVRQRMSLRLILLPFLAAILLNTAGFTTPAPVAYPYVATDLGALGGEDTEARAINGAGHVVGLTRPDDGASRAFLWRQGTLLDLHPTGAAHAAEDSAAFAISDTGIVAGLVGNLPVLWRDETMEILPALSGGVSGVMDINATGLAVGYSLSADFKQRAVAWREGTISELPLLPGYQESVANAISDDGLIVGRVFTSRSERAVLWQDGQVVDLGALGGKVSSALAIDEAGRVFGFAETAKSERHAFVWKDGVMTDLGTLGGKDSNATAGNRQGAIVGFSHVSAPNQATQAFIVANVGSPMIALETLVDPAAGWSSFFAWDVNEAGQIVGFGEHDGETRAYLLTPTASPRMPQTGGGYGATRQAGDLVAIALLAMVPWGAFALGRARRR